MAPAHATSQVNDQFCDGIIRSAAVCSVHSGKERSYAKVGTGHAWPG